MQNKPAINRTFDFGLVNGIRKPDASAQMCATVRSGTRQPIEG
jgi:hypothetical protein